MDMQITARSFIWLSFDHMMMPNLSGASAFQRKIALPEYKASSWKTRLFKQITETAILKVRACFY